MITEVKPGIELKTQVKLSLTAIQWQLYDTPGAKAAARSMNSRIAKALNVGDDKAAFKVLKDYAEFGACDSEPQYVLNYIMDKMNYA
jgi:hypothetical protein